jgi:hypothetical protein
LGANAVVGHGQHLSLTNQGLGLKRILAAVYRKRSGRRKGFALRALCADAYKQPAAH